MNPGPISNLGDETRSVAVKPKPSVDSNFVINRAWIAILVELNIYKNQIKEHVAFWGLAWMANFKDKRPWLPFNWWKIEG